MQDRPQHLTLRRPDDWHLHLRDGPMLGAVLGWSARTFGRAIIMPNLTPPVTDSAAATAYKSRIMAAMPEGSRFQPLMTCYLTDRTDPDDLEAGFRNGTFVAAKLYPAGATTNSSHGVSRIEAIDAPLHRMQAIGMPLLIHGEVVDPAIDIFDRERAFIDRELIPLRRRFPDLKVVMEHITTEDAADYLWADTTGRLAATITPQHLLINRNHILVGGIRPHMYCLPVAKRERHRRALCRAATSGDARFFLGTDSAPHALHTKENACGCAGIFNAPSAMAAYATAFDEAGALDRLEAFASLNGPAFYGFSPNEDTIELERGAPELPDTVAVGDGAEAVVVFKGPGSLTWREVGSAAC